MISLQANRKKTAINIEDFRIKIIAKTLLETIVRKNITLKI